MSSSSALQPRSGRKRSHPLGAASALTTSTAAATALSELGHYEEPPTRKARRDVLSTQLESLQAELEHERSLRSLDQKRHIQAQQRLERKLDFALEEAQEAKTLMEELREESEMYAEQLRSKYTRLQMEYRDLQTTLDEDRANRADEDAEEDPQVEALQERLEAQQEENASLKELVIELRQDMKRLQEELVKAKVSQPTNQENPVLAAPQAPSSVMKELNTTRIQLAEMERKNRQLKRVNDDLQVKANSLVHSQEHRKSAAARAQQLEQTLKDRDKNLALVQAELQSWKDFGARLGQTLAPTSTSDKAILSSNPNIPPEVTVVQRFLQDATKQARQAQSENEVLQQNLEKADETAQKLESTIRELEQAQKAAKKEHEGTLKKVEMAEKQIQVLQGQEAVWKREVESLRSIVKTFDDLPLTGTSSTSGASDARLRMLQAALDAAQQELKVIKEGQQTIQDELDAALNDKAELQKTHNTVLEKFGKLREAVFTERAKSEKAEARAVHAETLSGKGAFNPETTRVIHLKQNPLTEALKQEVMVLKRQVEALSGGEAKKVGAGGIDVDPNKLHQRLKESFKEQIGRFREGVYLLTGFKVDMIPDGERPRFKVRSLFAEQESDHLLFQWPEGTEVDSLDLLDTDLAKLLTRTPSYEYITRFHSLPAFLASTQLSLFEKQTMM